MKGLDCIYHYTKFDSFASMLKNAVSNNKITFWASSAYTMDDQMEMAYGYPLLNHLLSEFSKQRNLDNKQRLDILLTKLYCTFSGPDPDYFLPKDRSPFVISFTRALNSDFMWKNYGDEGKGICLFFDQEKIKSNTDDKMTYLYDVAYVNNEKNDLEIWLALVKLIEDQAKFCQEITPLLKYENDIDRVKMFLLNTLCPIISALVKGEDFTHEEEVRWMKLCDNKEAKCRKRNCDSINYIDVEIPLDCLVGIETGPNFDRIDELHVLCEEKGLVLNNANITLV